MSIKRILIFILSLLVFTMVMFYVSFQIDLDINYSDNEAFFIEMKGADLKILQLTDFHMAYGVDYNDRKLFKLIEALVEADTYDLIVVTGDQTMSILAPWLFRRFVNFMDALGTPWTFIFGNHESDFHHYSIFLRNLYDKEHMFFKVGPKLESGGLGNFKITFTKNELPFYHFYFLDTKAERDDYTEEEGIYDYLSFAQVEWYKAHVSKDLEPSVVFMHTPLRQMMNPEVYDGIFDEKKVYAQGRDTGFFEAMKVHERSVAAFFGHDHMNDFTTMVDGIMLGYGRITGYNAYGHLERGGRVIYIDQNQEMTTYLILASEVGIK
jgi:predicted MPP superfamily phosphohydrolase